MLNETEVRVLGSLVEKQVTTPEYYPLTLNALTLACNQKNNRHPVTHYDENTVTEAVDSLREKNLVYVFHGSTSRVPKYKHVVPEVMHLSPPEVAIMCVLMLRGTQTPGELRGNASRLYQFSGLEEIQQTLDGLISKDPDPMVMRLPRQPGQKEARFVHLLSGPVDVEAFAAEEETARLSTSRGARTDRVEKLEGEMAELRAAIQDLQEQFERFKRQFE
ncbi:MAG TPA: YceH family protein [Pyrinomonadaceae bacterium]|nr:YceH family protein [Pyrinomonadaceae bacterium]